MKIFRSVWKSLRENPLCFLSLVVVGFTVFLLALEMRHGVHYFDVFVYLNNALNFSGVSVGNTNLLSLAPLIPFITSLFFRLGFVSGNVIMIIDAIIFIVGVIGLYLLFKERFTKIQSIMGSFIFMSFPLIISWAVSGGTDIPGISFSIWTIYFLVKGFRGESKLLYFVFPMLILAFLTRYTAAVIIFPIIFYIIINIANYAKIKNIIISFLGSLAIFTPIFLILNEKLSNISLVNVLFTASIFVGLANGFGDAGYNPDYLYYLKNFLNYVAVGPIISGYSQILNPSQGYPSIFAYILALIVLLGILFYLFKICKQKLSELKEQNQRNSIFQIIIIVLLGIGTIICFFNFSYIFTEIIFLFTCLMAYYFFRKSEEKVGLDLLFLIWLGSFFIFHSITTIKLDRYFIAMLPALSYFFTLGLVTIVSEFEKIKNLKVDVEKIYLLIGILILAFSTVTFIGHVPQHCLITDIEFASHWLSVYDPQYQNEVIFADYGIAYSWCLKKEVKSVPVNLNSVELAKLLKNSGSKYYIDTFSDPKPQIEGYHAVQDTDVITIYERN